MRMGSERRTEQVGARLVGRMPSAWAVVQSGMSALCGSWHMAWSAHVGQLCPRWAIHHRLGLANKEKCVRARST